jgi:hypothetical protein
VSVRQTIVWSVVGHVALFAAVSRCELRATDTIAVEEPAPRMELVEVVLEPAPLAAPEATTSESPTTRIAAAATTTTRRGTPAPEAAAITTTTTTTEEPRRTGQLVMRRPELALSRDAAERIAAAGGKREETPTESRWAFDPKIRVIPGGGGMHEVRDRVARVKIAPDGSVDIESAPDFTFHVTIPNPWKIAVAQLKDVAAWYENPYRERDVGRMQDLPKHLTAVENSCNSYSDTMCITSDQWQAQWAQEDAVVAGTTVVHGSADITGWLHRKYVGDPYASRKLKILDQTREERVRIGEEHRAEQADRTAELVQRNLVRLWATTSDPAARRTALFEIWDECVEGEVGERARAMVIGWIRAKLGPNAYSAEELHALNARRSSKQSFAP